MFELGWFWSIMLLVVIMFGVIMLWGVCERYSRNEQSFLYTLYDFAANAIFILLLGGKVSGMINLSGWYIALISFTMIGLYVFIEYKKKVPSN